MKSIVIVYAGSEVPMVTLSKIDNIVRKYALDNTPIHISQMNDDETAQAIASKIGIDPGPHKIPEEMAITYIGENYLKDNKISLSDLKWKLSSDYVRAQKVLVKSKDDNALINGIKILSRGPGAVDSSIRRKYHYSDDIDGIVRNVYNTMTI